MDAVTIDCPFCAAEIRLEGNQWRYTCNRCGGRMDSRAQLAYERGHNLFEYGREVMAGGRDASSSHAARAKEAEAIELYQRAYSEIRQALRYELTDEQRGESIQIMTDLSRFFARRMMTSGLEANYWARVMTEFNAQQEWGDVQRRLSGSISRGFGATLRRWRWQMRSRQLRRALRKLDAQIRQFEELIGFADSIRPRRPLTG
ncbi:MAG: hypothetical protein ACOX9A_08095 [Anaerolineae bacterium]|jgi:glucan phosphorylase